MPQTRQLAAIIFTDIVGYTALMGEDEQKAFELLRKNRELQQALIKRYNGTWIKELGDGVLASFHTVTDAVLCAGAIQHACANIPDLKLRIGIHLGEVVFENDDVFGDGVNIASRIQSIAAPGTIYISEPVYNNISNKQGIQTRFIKEESLKNVKEPVKIYQVQLEGQKLNEEIISTNPGASIKSKGKKSQPNKKPFILVAGILLILIAGYFVYSNFQKKGNTNHNMVEKSIAVLPFVNMSSDKENEYFSDGISSEITNQLSKINSLDVRAWSSSVQFKNSVKSLVEIADALHASIILSGNIQKAGNKIRLHAELTDAKTSKRIWGNEYDREWGDIFLVQSELAEQIAAGLNASLTIDEKKRLELKPTDNPRAYEYYLQGNQLNDKFVRTLKQEFFDNSKLEFEKAIELDSNYALAHAGLASLYNTYTDLVKHDSAMMALQIKEIEKAYSIAPDLEFVNATRGKVFKMTGNLDEAYRSFRKAFEINPNNTNTLFEFGLFYSDLGLIDRRITLLKKAAKLDPINAAYFGFLGGAEVHVNRLKEGLADLQTAFRLEPTMFYMADRIAYVYALQDNLQESEIWLKKFLTLLPPERAASFYKGYGQYTAYCYAKLGNKKKALEISKDSRVLLVLGMKEEVMKDFIEGEAKANPGSSDYMYISPYLSHKDFDIIRNDPRFLELMKKKRKRYELINNRYDISLIEN